MAKHSPITRADNWFRGEAKRFEMTIVDDLGAPVPLTGVGLQWLLLRHAGSEHIFITKDPGDFETPEGDDDEVAVWVVGEDEYTDTPSGWYYYELWDRTAHALLAKGGALLQAARLA